MKITQGQFSFLPDLTDEEIKKQIEYGLDQGWSIAVEHTDDPHPRNTYWSMLSTPMFDLRDPAGVMLELNACRKEFPDDYVKVLAFDGRAGGDAGYIALRMTQPRFSNARSIRNGIDRARLRQANRLFAGRGEPLDRAALETITAEDIRVSRVFNQH